MRHAFYSTPKFRRWLRSLSPREELIARMALRDDVREPARHENGKRVSPSFKPT